MHAYRGLILLAALAAFSLPSLAAPGAEETLERSRQLSTGDPWLRRVLSEPSRLASSVCSARADRLEARLGSRADQPIDVRQGRYAAPIAQLRVLEAPAETIRYVEGRGVVAHSAGATSVWSLVGEVVEQTLLVESPQVPLRLTWQLRLRSDVTSVRREASGALLFVRHDGEGVLRIPPAYAVDARGRRVGVAARWHEERVDGALWVTVAFDLNLGELSSPVLVDPALESAFWKPVVVSGPSPRHGHSMAFDPISQRVMLFGGIQPGGELADTWAYDGTWVKVAPTTTSPPARRDAMFSAVSGGLLLFGGRAGTLPFGDAWLFQASNWQPAPGAAPSARFDASLAFAPQLGALTDVAVLYGSEGFTPKDETWFFAGGSWSAAPPATTTPGGLTGHTSAYDTTTSRVLVFGGRLGNLYKNQLWSFDGVDWTNLGAGAVSERAYHAMSYDVDRGVAVVFGGQDAFTYQPDTWEWDSTLTAWTSYPFSPGVTAPSHRIDSALVYDPVRKRSVLFGGFDNTSMNDTWEYRPLGGSCQTASECDGLPCIDGACCSVPQCDSCEACSPTTGTCVPVVNAPDPDSCSGADSCDASGQCKPAEGSPCTNADQCASGFCTDGVCCDSPCQGACEACDVNPGTCTLVQGAARHGSCDGSGPCGQTCTGTAPTCTFAGANTPCSASCEGAQFVAGFCDGFGQCDTPAPEPCPNGFACDGDTCRDSCSQDDHCAGGRVCRQGACVPASDVCVSTIELQREDGTLVDCSPYTCSSGACRESCTLAAQCASGNLCDTAGRCVATDSVGGSEDEGCGCHVPGRSRAPLRGATVLLVLAAWSVRRRRNHLSSAAALW